MISIDVCPVCGGTQFTPSLTAFDFTVSHETFFIKSCNHCHMGITSPRPDNDTLHLYYQSENYISHSGRDSGLTGKMYRAARKYTLQWKKRIVEKYSNKGKLLDIGCGTGEFLKVMQINNWEVVGVEPSFVARKKAESLIQQKVLQSLEDVNVQSLNAITLWHVLEHVPDLVSTLQKIHQLLHPDGNLYIAVPNYQSPDAEHYKENWAGYDVPRHLWHFSKESMALLLKQNGFVLNSILPMKLDAYYISLMSEKNKGKSSVLQFVQGFYQGLRSNMKGKQQTNHSSLIYIAQPL